MMMEKIKILVVDDEKVVRDGCHRVLTGKGYEVLTAENGQLAMDLLASESIDIVLLDLKMPVMSGEEVLEKTRTQYPDVSVIIITGHGTVDTAVECMKKGAGSIPSRPNLPLRRPTGPGPLAGFGTTRAPWPGFPADGPPTPAPAAQKRDHPRVAKFGSYQ